MNGTPATSTPAASAISCCSSCASVPPSVADMTSTLQTRTRVPEQADGSSVRECCVRHHLQRPCSVCSRCAHRRWHRLHGGCPCQRQQAGAPQVWRHARRLAVQSQRQRQVAVQVALVELVKQYSAHTLPTHTQRTTVHTTCTGAAGVVRPWLVGCDGPSSDAGGCRMHQSTLPSPPGPGPAAAGAAGCLL